MFFKKPTFCPSCNQKENDGNNLTPSYPFCMNRECVRYDRYLDGRYSGEESEITWKEIFKSIFLLKQ
jgi:endogenous inhibitor of DNA gyrase (YacG/DUF329 family)